MDSKKPLRRSERKVKSKDSTYEAASDSTTSRLWSKTEKSQLLAALEIYDETDIGSISECIPTKSSQQIEYYIRNVKRKAVILCNKVPIISELEKWIKLLNKVNKIPDVSKCDRLTIPLFLISIFETFPNPALCEGIDFKAAYELIFCIMAEIPPKQISRKTMEFVNKSFSEMGLMISENTDLKKYVLEKCKDSNPASANFLKDIFNPLNIPDIVLPLSKGHVDQT